MSNVRAAKLARPPFQRIDRAAEVCRERPKNEPFSKAAGLGRTSLWGRSKADIAGNHRMTVLMQQGLADDGGFAISWPEWKTATPTELLEQYEREAKKKVINGKGSDSRSLAELLDVFMEYPALSLLAFGGQVSEDQKLFLLQL